MSYMDILWMHSDWHEDVSSCLSIDDQGMPLWTYGYLQGLCIREGWITGVSA